MVAYFGKGGGAVNSREQALQRRVAYLEAQNTALMTVLDRAIQDIEVAESVACAFAWDLFTEIDVTRAAADSLYSDPAYNATIGTADEIEESVIENWQKAVEARK